MADEGTTPREWTDRELVRERRRAWLALGHRARLAWLEEAKRFAARALTAAAERRRGRAVSREPRR